MKYKKLLLQTISTFLGCLVSLFLLKVSEVFAIFTGITIGNVLIEISDFLFNKYKSNKLKK